MTLKQAYRLAICAMQAECQRLAVSGNLWEQYALDAPHTRRASK